MKFRSGEVFNMFTRRFPVVLLVGIAIPIIGYLVGFWILSDTNRDLAEASLPNIEVICSNERAQQSSQVAAVCANFNPIILLRDASIWSGVLGLTIPFVSLFAAVMCGTKRERLSIIFPPLIRVIVILLSISVLVQGAILTYAAYVGESYAIERVHFILIGAIGLGALVAAFNLISAAAEFGKNLQTTVIGTPLSEAEEPRFFAYVNSLAEKLGARRPDNIVVGLEPNFFATSADVTVLGNDEPLRGETLYVSAPLARLLTEAELSSVIGHELGHFRGEDTAYSLKFAPVYAGLAHSIGAVESDDNEGASGLAKLPARATLSYIYDVFSRSESAISRDRELKADQAGAEVSSAKALATTLAKVSLYAQLWSKVREDNVERLNQGKITNNLSTVFGDIAKYDIEHAEIEEIIENILSTTIEHPTDTHPTLGTRLQTLGISPSDIKKDDLLVPAHSAIVLLNSATEIEEELSVYEHRLMVALGHANIPESPESGENGGNYFLEIVYNLAASMVLADGKTEPEEIQVAEEIGARLIDGFDPVDFREICQKSNDIPDVATTAKLLRDALNEQQKKAVLHYLEAIANVDGSVALEEEKVLATIKEEIDIGD